MTWAVVLAVITVVSVLLTVAAGYLGLRQGHFRNGKITKRGKLTVGSMAALGVVTIVSAFVGQQISEAKEREDAKARNLQFNSQMSTLGGMQRTLTDSIRRLERLTENSRAVQSTLDLSIERQQTLAIATAENLRLSRILQVQSRVNAERVIRRVSDEANRATLADLGAMVSIDCTEANTVLPRFGAQAITFYVSGDSGRAEFRSNSSFAELLMPNTRFDRFRGDLVGYETFSSWTRARVSVRIFAFERLHPPPDPDGTPLIIFVPPGTRLQPGALASGPPRRLPCPVRVTLTARGWTLFEANGDLYEIDGGYRFDASDIPARPRRTIDLGQR